MHLSAEHITYTYNERSIGYSYRDAIRGMVHLHFIADMTQSPLPEINRVSVNPPLQKKSLWITSEKVSFQYNNNNILLIEFLINGDI